MSSVIYEVISVSWALDKKLPPNLLVSATGKTSTPNWTDGQLKPRAYVAPPADGVQEFDFFATGPAGVSTPVISKLLDEAHGTVEAPDWLKGVRVHAKTNSKTVLF